MEILANVLIPAFENYPNLERVVIYIHRRVKLKKPCGRLTTHFVKIDANLTFNVKQYEEMIEFINPALLLFPVSNVYTDKHEEAIYIELDHIVEEE